MLQSFMQWADMGGYGGYVWSVLGLLLVLLGYELLTLRAHQRRCDQAAKPPFKEEQSR